MRAAALVLLVAAPAHAEVFGDAVAGTGLDELRPTLGLRVGLDRDGVGPLLGVDWRYWKNRGGGDFTEYEHRGRALASLNVTLAQDWTIRAGGGLEVARNVTTGYAPHEPPIVRAESFRGLVIESAVGYFRDAGRLQLGGELVVGNSTYSGPSVALLLAVRFGA